MNVEHFTEHTSRRYNAELEAIRSKILAAGGLVEEQLTGALAALVEGDTQRAERVIGNDAKLNALEREIDEECTQLLARRQPVASDLRLVITVIKCIANLERMGDEAKRIARMAVEQAGRMEPRARYGELRHLGERVRRLVHDALDAFARSDVELAVRVLESDRDVDREYESLTRELLTFMMSDPRSIPRVLEVMWSARALERLGDRACNLCEYVIYTASGRDVRHVGLEQLKQDARRSNWEHE